MTHETCAKKKEALSGVRADVPRAVAIQASHPDEQGLSSFLKLYDSRSHGESFLDLFTERIRPGGLYLLDEPEAPLSPFGHFLGSGSSRSR